MAQCSLPPQSNIISHAYMYSIIDLLLMCKSVKAMGRKTSNSLQTMARSLGVEAGAYSGLRNIILEHLDEKTGSRDATVALDSASIDRFLEAFVDQPIAKNYARILENLDSAHNEAYDKAISVLRKLTYERIRNLKKKTWRKIASRQISITSPTSTSKPTIIGPREEEDECQILLPEIETIIGNTRGIEPDSISFPLMSARDETVRPYSPNVTSATVVPTVRPISLQDPPRNRSSSPNGQSCIENNDATRANRYGTKRTYDHVLSDDVSYQDIEEQTDEEAEELHGRPRSRKPESRGFAIHANKFRQASY